MSDPERDPSEGEKERDAFEELATEEEPIGDPFAELGERTGEDPIEGSGKDGAEETGKDAVEGAGEDPFEEVDEGEPIEDVWETLGDDGAGGEATLAPVDEWDGPKEEVVDKRAFCQRCRYLSEPPAVHCTHEGTEIVEVVDNDRFRVRGCPMVDKGGPESDAR